mmetsp:Transcript_3076/g.9293  ORF Transcript_3076/g.9293 Transcript_3076/m.9293 type:complete len:124 (+) Transcript_3076:176-547(+)
MWPSDAPFQAGDEVQLTNLSKADLNGARGVAVGYDAERGRVSVRLVDGGPASQPGQGGAAGRRGGGRSDGRRGRARGVARSASADDGDAARCTERASESRSRALREGARRTLDLCGSTDASSF